MYMGLNRPIFVTSVLDHDGQVRKGTRGGTRSFSQGCRSGAHYHGRTGDEGSA